MAAASCSRFLLVGKQWLRAMPPLGEGLKRGNVIGNFLFGNVSHVFQIMTNCLPLHLLQEYKLFC